MKQKELTSKQKLICDRLKALMEEAEEAGVKFVFDQSDYLLSAYNGEGIDSVDSDYSANMREGDDKFDWTETFDIAYPDCVNSSVEDVYINPHEMD